MNPERPAEPFFANAILGNQIPTGLNNLRPSKPNVVKHC
jgi:hypothetical protein